MMVTTHSAATHHAKAEDKPRAKAEPLATVQGIAAGPEDKPGKIKRNDAFNVVVVEGDGYAQLPKAQVGDHFEIHRADGMPSILCPEGEQFLTGETSARPAVLCTKLSSAVWGKLNG